MKRYLGWMVMVVCLAGMAAAKSKPVRKGSAKATGHVVASKSAASKSGQKKTAAKGKRGVSVARGKGTRVRTVRGKAGRRGHAAAPRRMVQASPSSDRYREIQQALAAKGYLKSEPTGVWDQSSVDAMKRFQEDQKLTSTGKLNSLSLIALGLGPKDRAEAPPEK